MSLETRITEAAQAAVRRLDEDLRGRLAALTDELTAAAGAAGADAEAAHATAAAELSRRIEELNADLAARDSRLADLEEQLTRDREAQARQIGAMREEADAALAEAERALAEAVRQASLQNEQGRAAALLESSRLARQDVATHVQALAHAVSGMDDATTLSEVLDALAEGLAAQAPRSAVLVFQQDRARIWRRHGFPADAPGIGADLHLPEHADLKAILDSARPAIVEGDGHGPVLGLAALPDGHQGLAVPVAIGGQAAALVYADGGDDPQALPPGWSDAVEVLARHAARCLETLTAMRAAGYARASKPAVVVPMPPHLRVVQRPTLETSMGDALEQARRVARLLVSEIRLNREADVMAGRAAGDLGTRLGDDIERARRTYRQRVPEAVPGREALFDEELVRTLANGDATLLRTGS
ncbi:hypothetical protein TBR22_A19180 [Luteitalea sp. TBR-22]|nr:hypothetical protein TBR22_A19180 [Luteitalea sp. TBR-22]